MPPSGRRRCRPECRPSWTKLPPKQPSLERLEGRRLLQPPDRRTATGGWVKPARVASRRVLRISCCDRKNASSPPFETRDRRELNVLSRGRWASWSEPASVMAVRSIQSVLSRSRTLQGRQSCVGDRRPADGQPLYLRQASHFGQAGVGQVRVLEPQIDQLRGSRARPRPILSIRQCSRLRRVSDGQFARSRRCPAPTVVPSRVRNRDLPGIVNADGQHDAPPEREHTSDRHPRDFFALVDRQRCLRRQFVETLRLGLFRHPSESTDVRRTVTTRLRDDVTGCPGGAPGCFGGVSR